jgi:hypothetical protein
MPAASSDKLADTPSWVNNWRSLAEIVADVILRCAENSRRDFPARRQGAMMPARLTAATAFGFGDKAAPRLVSWQPSAPDDLAD